MSTNSLKLGTVLTIHVPSMYSLIQGEQEGRRNCFSLLLVLLGPSHSQLTCEASLSLLPQQQGRQLGISLLVGLGGKLSDWRLFI